MCGIVGIVNRKESSVESAVDCLSRLEYRGYDSAGVACMSDGIDRRRATGKLSALRKVLNGSPIFGKVTIGHTRWATHGPATDSNAHPHQVGRVCLVHNGIIENFKDLKQELIEGGWVPSSDTDTEVVAALIDRELGAVDSSKEAISAVLSRLVGMFALAIIIEGEEDRIWVARKGSPLVVGHGSTGMFAGSDAIALGGMTNEITYLEDGDWGYIDADRLVLFNVEGDAVSREKTIVSLDALRIEKAGHKHFMLKEVFEQPVVLSNALSYAREMGWNLCPEIDFAGIDRIVMSACGTAAYACEIAKFWFEDAGIPVDVVLGSEFRHRRLLGDPARTLAVFVSQSGETADTLSAFHLSKEYDRPSLAVVNVETSTLAREASAVVPIHAGPEIGVASTKAFTAQLLALRLVALQAAAVRSGKLDEHVVEELLSIPAMISASLGIVDECEQLGYDLSKFDNALFLGRGQIAPLACEAALKLKEISYIHAEGYPSGELKHGPIALVDENLPVVVFAPRDAAFEKTVSNMHEVGARHGKVILVSDSEGISAAGGECWRVLRMPSCSSAIAPMVYAVAAQLLAYYAALARGTDVDQPRNLAKSVTVE